MDFIGQAFTVIWEAILLNATFVFTLLGLLVASWIFWMLRATSLSKSALAASVALIIAGIAFFMLPSLFSASFADISYWVDWLFHLVTVFAVFIYSYLLLLPLLSGLFANR